MKLSISLVLFATFFQGAQAFFDLDRFIDQILDFFVCEILRSETNPRCFIYGFYQRVHNNAIRDRTLFELMEGEELEKMLTQYQAQKETDRHQGFCDHPTSTYKGKVTDAETCFHPDNQIIAADREMEDTSNFKPWTTPSLEGGTLLAENPGIWSFDNFLTHEETTQLLDLVDKYGNQKGLFGPCKHEGRHLANAHPMDGKQCFKISPHNACEGPYDISECLTATEPEDGVFVSTILSKFETMWPGFNAYPYAKFQLASGGTPPVDLHMDNEKIISFVLYLSDGGAKMIFPHVGEDGLAFAPKTGRAHTWLNAFEDGTRNPTSDHAVQAHPASEAPRLVMLLEIPSDLKLMTA